MLTLGVLCGSASWWVILTWVVSALRTRVTVRWLTWVNRISGVVLLGFAVASLASALVR
jgi:threonine/homoserine/homoserine lactone efflux protein